MKTDGIWNSDKGLTLAFPEMTLAIVTGDRVKPLSYVVRNVNLLRAVVDQLRLALRGIHESERRVKSKDGASESRACLATLISR